jgi:hypothetical protein
MMGGRYVYVRRGWFIVRNPGKRGRREVVYVGG